MGASWGTWTRRAAGAVGVAVIGAAISLMIEYGVVQEWFAPRGVAWTTDGTSADLPGMTASGEVEPDADGLLRLTGSVLDDRSDHLGALLLIDVDHGGRVEEIREYNSAGANLALEIGKRPAGRSFPDVIRAISVNECLVSWSDDSKRFVRTDRCGAAPVRIWSADQQ